MKQIFLNKNEGDTLLLIFAGWGMDERPFEQLGGVAIDVCVCYDYRTLDFDFGLLDPYRRVDVVAWSMGVWVAGTVLSRRALPIGDSVAINGTHFPIDDERGICRAIFDGTLDNLSGESILKFWRRMCRNSADYAHFMSHAPVRDTDSLRDELAALRSHYQLSSAVDYKWGRVVVGLADRIFTPANQLNAWRNHPNINQRDIAHLPDFRAIIDE